jgi:thiol-disulfide isomerase/thioredoxin
MSTRRVIGWTVLAVAVLAVAVFGLASKSSRPGGRRAPQLPREALVGAPATLSHLITGAGDRPVAVLFWASWCGPCEKEAPQVERFATSSAGTSRIVGVNWSDGLSGARSFIHHYGWTFPNVRDSEGLVGNEYNMTGLPTTFIVSPSQKIVAVLRGPQTQATLQSALAKASKS